MVPVLKKEDQIKICNKLNKITTVIQQRKQQLSKLDELAKSRFFYESTTLKMEVAA